MCTDTYRIAINLTVKGKEMNNKNHVLVPRALPLPGKSRESYIFQGQSRVNSQIGLNTKLDLITISYCGYRHKYLIWRLAGARFYDIL